MATKTRAKPRRPVSKAAKGRLGKAWGKTKSGYARTMKAHPWLSVVLQVLLGIVAVVALILGVVLESVLYYLVVAVGAFGALAIRRAQQMERARQGVPPKPSTSGPRKPAASPPPSSSTTKPAAGGVVKCTATGKPTDDCDCYSRHIVTEKGVKNFGRPLGTPYGSKKAGGK